MKYASHSEQRLPSDVSAGTIVHSTMTRLSARLRASLSTALMITAAAMLRSPVTGAQALPWMNTSLSPEQRAALLVPAMTLDEKIEQIAMNTGPNPDLPGCGV